MPDSEEIPGSEAILSFGPFLLYPARKLLMVGAEQVRLSSRALEILVILTRQAGNLVSTEFLLSHVWPNTVVDENSVRVQISSLRKALRQISDTGNIHYIDNVPGRGYCFAKDVVHIREEVGLREQANLDASVVASSFPPSNLPKRLTRLIGREDTVRDIVRLLHSKRMVSLIGPGGIGKTSVALAVAERRHEHEIDDICLVDLAPVTDPNKVWSAMVSALGMSIQDLDPISELCTRLRIRRILIVLDNCEHLIDAVATLVERLLVMTSNVHLLATSREALHTAGEWVYRVPPLAIPDERNQTNVELILPFPAIQLFVERATTNATAFAVSTTDLRLISHICRQLDGIPLAIELAAARVDSLGVHGLAAHLAELPELLNRGRRTARPSHRTLAALLNWSIDLLTEPERVVFQRLSIFPGAFTIEDAASVCSCPTISSGEVSEIVMTLVAKSLVSGDVTDEIYHYHLLIVTRLYARQRLEASGEAQSLASRHAQYVLQLLALAEHDLPNFEPRIWRAKYKRVSEDLRVALDWAFSDSGEPDIGMMLTIAALYPAIELVMQEEYRHRINQALATLKLSNVSRPELSTRLYAALGVVGAMTSSVPLQQEMLANLYRAALAEPEPTMQIELLYIATTAAFGSGNYPLVLELARQSGALAGTINDQVAEVHANRFLSYALHYLGQHAQARQVVQNVLANPGVERRGRLISQVPFSVSMRIILSRILWLQGRPERALEVAYEAVVLSRDAHPFAICQSLSQSAVPIALWAGEEDLAQSWNDLLMETTSNPRLALWHSWGQSFRKILEKRAIARDSSASNKLKGPARNDQVSNQGHHPNAIELDMLATLEPEAIHDSTWQRVESGIVGWCAPEVIRVRGELLLASGDKNASSAAEALFRRGYDLAREQASPAWQLRCAISLLRFWRGGKREEEGVKLTLDTLQEFESGASTADLTQARLLLAQYRHM